MKDVLHNPVYNALLTGDAVRSLGTENVKYFDEQVSPFAGFDEENETGFDDLYDLLPIGRKILYAIPKRIKEPRQWQVLHEIEGLQFVFGKDQIPGDPTIHPVPLDHQHIEQMVQLADLTKPGPFGTRTIEFGHYHGIFQEEKLVAMTGQRLHVADYTEISAVCTHPDHLGKGYAAALIVHQLDLIIRAGQKAFLHVRADNDRAIALYERLGFKVRRPMVFYFMKKRL
ncbi:MAG TPA: GNAT family N-acetyltransferase [Chryseolinea sp.]|nr:GNAT family N-acetyltransferase [Chryseolinea sp.]